jgi:hypothetical protein
LKLEINSKVEAEKMKICAIPVRLTLQQRAFIWPGLNLMTLGYITHRETGSARYSYPFRVHPLEIRPRPGEDPGTFGDQIMQAIMDLWAKLKGKKQKRVRLRLTFIGLSACILAVRVGREHERRLQKKKHTFLENRAAVAVIASLERELKRARRAYAAEAGEPAYKAMRALWFAHLRWTRMHLVYFRPQRVKTQLRRVQRMLIDEGCERAKAGLINKNFEPPPEKELRRLVRLAVRYIRRGRLSTSVRGLIGNPRLAERFLSAFVLDRRDLNPIAI